MVLPTSNAKFVVDLGAGTGSGVKERDIYDAGGAGVASGSVAAGAAAVVTAVEEELSSLEDDEPWKLDVNSEKSN